MDVNWGLDFNPIFVSMGTRAILIPVALTFWSCDVHVATGSAPGSR